MKKNILFYFVLTTLNSACAQSDNVLFQQLSDSYSKEYVTLNIIPLKIRYHDNLTLIKSKDSIELQQAFFKQTLNNLKTLEKTSLEKKLQIDYDLMAYESELNLDRLALELRWLELDIESISKEGLYTIPMGKEWYAYFLKKWVSDEVTPNEIFQFGLDEISKVKSKIKSIQVASGLDSISFYKDLNQSHFFYADTLQIENAIHQTRKIIEKEYSKLFPFTGSIPSVKVKRSHIERLKIAPAYYSNSTFFYTLFDKPFNKRLVDIFFLHEGFPGHHYQTMVNNNLPLSDVRKLNWYSGYREGWASYVEEFGKELGVYKTDYDYFGKWEWDIVRSVRVCLDVGINYYGWSDAKAEAFWKSHISGQDNIMDREIIRMKLQPAQVITYKYGANEILKWRDKEMQKEDFDYIKFHKKVLENGQLPFAVLNKQF